VIDDRRMLDLIDEIYAASLDARRWSAVITSLGRVFHCVGGALLQRDRNSAEMGFIEFGGLDAPVRAAYEEYYSACSVWMPAAFARTGELVIGHELAPDKREFERSEFYNDWLRPQGVYDAIGGVIHRSPGSLTVVTVLRAERAGLVTDADKQQFSRLLPHVRRSLDLHRRLYGLRLERDGALQALDALRIGIVMTDRTGRVMFANRVAEGILRRCDGLTAIRGRLCAERPADTQQLTRLIGDAARTTRGLGETAGGMLALPTRLGPPVTVLVSPCPRLGLLEPAVLVFVNEAPGSPEFGARYLARLYGLTPAEVQLLQALVNGKRLSDYAGDTGISLNTAKTHLKQIFAKTGSSRQADLVRLVAGNPVLRMAVSRLGS